MKHKICIFAGTTEGRQFAALLKDSVALTACVATEYGEVLLDELTGIRVKTGRMNAVEMEAFFKEEGFERIIDATHPYAAAVTENIATAAKKAAIPLMRILRETQGKIAQAVYVSNTKEAGEYLQAREGNVFLTTGAKELSEYGLSPERVWARVLPSLPSLEACTKAGIPLSQVIAAQGPFSYEMNVAQLRDSGAKYMVTKASGKNGGFAQKIAAAKAVGVQTVIIGTPAQAAGYTVDEALCILEKTYSLPSRRIQIIGIGPGDRAFLTEQAKAAIEESDAVIGAASVCEMLGKAVPTFHEYQAERIVAVLNEHPSIRRAAVVMRGDVGFFSGAKKLVAALGEENVTCIPGISSAVLLAARLGVSVEDAAFVSLHGREDALVRRVATCRKVFVLTDSKNTPAQVIKKLCRYDLGGVRVAVGERLSYPDERITKATAKELPEKTFDALSVLYIENEQAQKQFSAGISDEIFVRGKVPMTKSEVRAVALSKLAPKEASVIWDVGAGTGSVSVECALSAEKGQVYAIEKNEAACELIAQNKRKFKTDNLHIVAGAAPEVLENLPAPERVFIGGSSGNLKDIIRTVLRKNAQAVIVVNTVTLETQSRVQACAEMFSFEHFEAVSLQVGRSRALGNYHMMQALSPVWIYTMHGGTLPC